MIQASAGRDRTGRTARTGWPRVTKAGKALSEGAVVAVAVVAGTVVAVVVPTGIAVPAAHGAAAASLLVRARTVGGRVRLRLALSAISVAAGGLHYVLVDEMGASSPAVGVFPPIVRVLACVGIAACLGGAVAALVMAATEDGTTLTRLRRLLDGWLIAGSLFTVGWILLLHRADRGDDASASFLGLARVVADILVFGLLVALRFCLPHAQRTATTVAVLALVALAAGDVLRILPPEPGSWDGIPLSAASSAVGLLLVAVAPWLPGGVSVVGFGQRMMPVIGVVAAFVPVVFCALAIAAHTIAGGPTDTVMSALAVSVLLALGVRQGVIHADHLRITHETAEREDRYRTLVDRTSDVITIVSLDERVLYVSPAARWVYGYPPEDLEGARLPLYTHPDDREKLMQAVQTLRQDAESDIRGPGRRVSCRVQAADGSWRHVESTINHHPDGLIFISRDVSERVAQQVQLERLAYHDALTGLPNRALFADRVAHALRKRITDEAPPVVLFMDLDGFKAVNDSAGHAAGDTVLRHAARRLQSSVRAGDTVARLGGDEFAALLEWEAGAHPSNAQEVAQRILTALTQPYPIGTMKAEVSASIGMAVAVPGITPDQLLHQADLAMYAAKAAGKGRIRLHHAQPPHAHSGTPNG
ncbi:diguanylate cyclase domain-containing protein [Streptomyces sp. C1-1]|jgi:diguanylate cyclase (GGDEF)-like protein/PAS domain S-box-containing protein|uniref:diguanylate cyclase domain-containing protein n=1 Tax=Streptomyces sp. C1-1 TaxID=3231173 RepID=UPI003D06390E